ncbi:hypothetical protein CN671_11330 [Bacillus toyonensis]|nr:hypothetical protein CN671_11330 [Bacillus toyonensis]PFZ69362.1 hypothetical protein COL72_22080 [Bacillus toyonensis]
MAILCNLNQSICGIKYILISIILSGAPLVTFINSVLLDNLEKILIVLKINIFSIYCNYN